MNKNLREIFTSNRESLSGIRLPASADYGCATVRDLHTIHPLSRKYNLSNGIKYILGMETTRPPGDRSFN